jgi:predicted TIM-barrel fold metal-dependent hydrolase
MPYAEGTTFYDADSHIMELSDWLETYADPADRPLIQPLHLGAAGAFADQAVAAAAERRGDAEAAAKLEGALMKAKGWSALGAFDPAERSRALDLLGFDAQLVFSTFAATQFAFGDQATMRAGTRAHNRAMTEFCSDDSRLLAVGFAPWVDPDFTLEVIEEAIAMGCAAILVPSLPAKSSKSPSHPDYDPVWATLQDAGIPFVTHIGGEGRALPGQFHDNGLEVTDFLGGGENIRAKDYMALATRPALFFATLIFDGVFERFPDLRGGSIEQGASWVVSWLRQLDHAQTAFGRTEYVLRDLPLKPSEYVARQLHFTPFPFEDVGWLIDQCGDDLFLFSSDYPHPEGGRDPLGRFRSSLEGHSEATTEKFYSANFADLMAMP